MQNTPIIAALAALGVSVVIVALYHLAVVAPRLREARQLLAIHDEALGGAGGVASDRLANLEAKTEGLASDQERATARVRELDDLARTDISRIGFVRFAAFDTGAELSYALALLNRQGDGVVVSSIYSRTDTRTFGKAVEGFQPLSEASNEELRAIAAARQPKV